MANFVWMLKDNEHILPGIIQLCTRVAQRPDPSVAVAVCQYPGMEEQVPVLQPERELLPVGRQQTQQGDERLPYDLYHGGTDSVRENLWLVVGAEKGENLSNYATSPAIPYRSRYLLAAQARTQHPDFNTQT
eukprot:3697587-Rhodomonas_salina.1